VTLLHPGTTMELQLPLLTQSLQHLYDLYTIQAQFACRLIELLTRSIATVGGRWQEQLLQNRRVRSFLAYDEHFNNSSRKPSVDCSASTALSLAHVMANNNSVTYSLHFNRASAIHQENIV
jgi:hypothetical protein